MEHYSKARLLGIVLFAHAVSAISVASTPAPYTASSPSNEYASPTTAEPATPDYNNKYNYPPPQYPYSKQQAYDPMYGNPPTNHLAESFTPYSSLLSPRGPFLFHRLPSLFGAPAPAPVHSAPTNPENAAYPPYAPPSYPTHSGFVPSQPIYEPQQYPLNYPSKYPKNTYAYPSCDYQLLQPYRASRPFLFYPQKPENLYDYPSYPVAPVKPNDPLYRYQPAAPPTYGSNYANNLPVYH